MTDTVRMGAYQQAIERLVGTDSVVLDIGTGAGIHALMAARAGAKHVYAIEPADSIQVAKQVAKANGLHEQITFLQGVSTELNIPEKADIVISDLRGALPWLWHHIPTIIDARERLLKPDGILVPQKDTVWAVPVESEEIYSKIDSPWKEFACGFDYSKARDVVVNLTRRERPKHEDFLASKQHVATLDYHVVGDPNMMSELRFRSDRDGTLHGISVWFDGVIHENIGFTNAPFEKELAYGSSFFPIEKPVALNVGDTIEVMLKARFSPEGYAWVWETNIIGKTGDEKASHKQSTINGRIFSFDKLKKRMSSHRPELSLKGIIQRDSLNFMTNGHTVAEVAEKLYTKHNNEFEKLSEALEYVRNLSQKYG